MRKSFLFRFDRFDMSNPLRDDLAEKEIGSSQKG